MPSCNHSLHYKVNYTSCQYLKLIFLAFVTVNNLGVAVLAFSYKKFAVLCTEQGTYPTTVASAIGLSNAAATGWKNGKQPRGKTIEALAEQLGCSIDKLLEDEKIPVTSDGGGISPTKQKAIQSVMNASDAEVSMLMDILDAWQKNKNPAGKGGADS